MGKFDGILLCTDFDGTFAHKAEVSPENCKAVQYFEENGGRFTVVSGRHPLFLKEHEIGFQVNAPLVGYNGALILDENTGFILHSGGRRDVRALEIAQYFWEKDERLHRVVAHDATRNNFRCKRDASDGFTNVESLKSHLNLPLYNILCVTKCEEDAISLRDDIISYVGDEFVICRSWGIGIEVICPNDQKGVAALRLKEQLGAKLLVAAGDFENDISMLKAADIGYAVANATDNVKEAADRVTVDYREHAIAAIIRELEQEL